MDQSSASILPVEYDYIRELEDNFMAYQAHVYYIEDDEVKKGGASLLGRPGARVFDMRGNFVKVINLDEMEEIERKMKEARFDWRRFRHDSPWHSITPTVSLYSEVRDFCCGLAAVKKNDKWGFIDTNGTLVAPCIYTYVWDFIKGYALVQESEYNEKQGYISTDLIKYWED